MAKSEKSQDFLTEPVLHTKKASKAQFPWRILHLLRLVIVFGTIAGIGCMLGNMGQIMGWLISFVFPKLGRRVLSCLSGLSLTTFVYGLEYAGCVELEFSGDKLPNHESAICIANHISDVDFLIFMNLAYRKGMLGNVKYMAKDSLKYIPFVGWGMYLMGMIFLKRNWEQDKKSIEHTFDHLTSNHVPVWAIAFLEGTRITPSKHAEAYEFAKSRNLQFFNQTLLPRVKGFKAMVTHFKGSHVKYVYDFTFVSPDGRRSIADVIGTGHSAKICVNVKRYPISEIPDSEEEITNWCYKSFGRKSQMISDTMKSNTKSIPHEPIYDDPLRLTEWWIMPFKLAEQEKKAK